MDGSGRISPWKWAGVLMVLAMGVALLAVGVAQRTVWKPADTATRVATPIRAHAAIIVEPGITNALKGKATLTASARDAGEIFLVKGRERDVLAFFEGQSTATVTGFDPEDPDKFTFREDDKAPDAASAVKDAQGADLWVQTWSDPKRVSVEVDDSEPGRWAYAAVTADATNGPARVSVTWPVEVSMPWSTPLIVAGLFVVVLSVVGAGYIVWEYRSTQVPVPERVKRSSPWVQQDPRRRAPGRGRGPAGTARVPRTGGAPEGPPGPPSAGTRIVGEQPPTSRRARRRERDR